MVRNLEASLTLVDQWEHYIVNFSIYYPLKHNEKMRINGDIEKLGSWNKNGPVDMGRGEEVTWLTGQQVIPWVK